MKNNPNLPPAPASVQADYLMAVERLLAAADAAREARNRLLATASAPSGDRPAPRRSTGGADR
jgi:hypothetical protein